MFLTVQINTLLELSSNCAIYGVNRVPSVRISKNVRIIIIALSGMAKRLDNIKYDGINPK
jgi:hypothetical protein